MSARAAGQLGGRSVSRRHFATSRTGSKPRPCAEGCGRRGQRPCVRSPIAWRCPGGAGGGGCGVGRRAMSDADQKAQRDRYHHGRASSRRLFCPEPAMSSDSTAPKLLPFPRRPREPHRAAGRWTGTRPAACRRGALGDLDRTGRRGQDPAGHADWQRDRACLSGREKHSAC
jgi:hypothetical protein